VASERLALGAGRLRVPRVDQPLRVLAEAGQFGWPDQGIFAYWVSSWLRRQPLRY
jgi:CDP-paratose 2-epimerase